MEMKTIYVKGRRIKVTRSNRKNKKFKAEVPISSGITANDLSRAMWKCKKRK